MGDEPGAPLLINDGFCPEQDLAPLLGPLQSDLPDPGGPGKQALQMHVPGSVHE